MKKIVSFLLISAVFLCSLTYIFYRDLGAARDYKIGLGIHADVTAKDAAEDTDGEALAEYTFAAIVIDEDGKVVDCELDASTDGAVLFTSSGTASIPKQITTKVTLGDDYGMSTYAKTTEWYAQADNFENTVKGKTLDEIKNLLVTAGENAGKGTDEVITAGCTIYVSGFVSAIEKAFYNTKSVKLSKPDINLGIAVSSSSTNAEKDTNGSATFTAVVNAAITDQDKIISCLTDEMTIELGITSSGKIEGKSAAYNTKRELGNDYGMSKYGLTEWYIQVDAFDKACEGKNADEIAALVENGYANQDIQSAGCTIYADGFAKAAVAAVD